MRIGVVTFPGSLDDRDAARAVRIAGGQPVALWHADAEAATRMVATDPAKKEPSAATDSAAPARPLRAIL